MCMQLMVTERPLAQPVQADGAGVTALCKMAIGAQMPN